MDDVQRDRILAWVVTGLAAVTAFLSALTLITREWIEVIFGVDPDHGDGSAEWALLAGLVVLTVLLALVARSRWRRLRTA